METRLIGLCLLFVFVQCFIVQGVSVREFYPFSRFTDAKLPANDDGSSGELTLSVPFPFFKSKYQRLFVNTNGVISFKDSVEEFTPITFPKKNNQPMIAPYWADVDTRNGGEVFYRQSTSVELFQRATNDVKKYFPGQFPSFQASWVFIATWQNVSRFRRSRSIYSGFGDPLKNTFQVVLITNGRHSFALFYYEKIEWTTGDASKSIYGGIPAQAGFNFGDGTRYYSVRGSQTDLIRQLPTLSNVGVPGMFVFRVDEAEITNGGCNTAGGLTLSPRSGLVLGGTIVELSGPCFNVTSDAVVCRFNGKIIAEGNIIDRYKASCVTPPLIDIGRMSVELSLDDGITYNFTSQFTSVALGRHGPGISGLMSKDWTRQIDTLVIGWNPHSLRTREPINIEVAKFDWETFELLENKTVVKANTANFGFEVVRDLVQTVYHMPPVSLNNSERYVSPLSIVTISAPKPARGFPARLYSEPFLAIPVKNITKKIKATYDKLAIPQRCKDWFGDDNFNVRRALDGLIGCPKSLEQAEADNRFMSDDYCKPPRTTSCIAYHNGSYHCFRSVFPNPNGAGQQCCYTKQGRLVVGPPGGGTVDRYHAGSSRFSTLQHLKEDIYPWYLCCRLSKSCGLYYASRPSENGTRYTPPQIATTFGDPHLVTLDGFQYTFNGYGEYTMVNIDEIGFKFQARMQPIKTKGTNSRGTFLMAFVLQDDYSDTVQVEMNSLKQLAIYVNGVEESFDTNTTLMEFDNVILTRQNESDLQVMFRSEISVSVSKNDFSLSFETLFPETFKGKTKGLLGVWDDDKKNDLTLPSGEQMDINSKSRKIHKFGQKWLLSSKESLFTYHEDTKYEDFVNKSYKPMFFDELDTLFSDKAQEIQARAACGGVKECLFDIAASGSLSFAIATKKSVEHFTERKKNISIVRVPLYFNCDGVKVSGPCKACHHMCVSESDHTVVIVLSVLFGILACVIACVIVFYYIYRVHKEPEPPKLPPKPEVKPKPREEGEKPTSEPTVMAFVLPAFPESKRDSAMHQ
ncbi:sushi domain-containing protein 2-like [Dendronephthya gigantea]|uniref:sushi domain-containing protein 2-like n=1 Tax=Dendronephthya gigantea TaxID=151771 RepID=UPI00106DC397|nr:sushi domain-containing protein 2-like [Dendronephthya gigantea]